MPKLTIGMAHFDDYDGVYFTLQSLRLHHKPAMKDVELLVVDNNPDTNASRLIRQHFESWMSRGVQGGVQYIPIRAPVGTSVSRDAIFKHASGDAVLVVDCHVLFPHGSIKRLIKFYDDNPSTNDLYQGPLLHDPLDNLSTHFSDEWGAEMWGRWSQMWQCKCGDEGVLFSIHEQPDETDFTKTICQVRLGEMGVVPITFCKNCQSEFPKNIPWPGHENKFIAEGYKRLGKNDDDNPFPIPGCGLGIFSCRREAWLGFNEHARGFGGEEMYIHEKYRQAGSQAMCLPFLKWLHRFGRPAGVKYPLTRWNKVRNYVLEFNELGLDLSPVYDEFVASGRMTEKAWKYLTDDPIHHLSEPMQKKCPGCPGGNGEASLLDVSSVNSAYEVLSKIPRDLDRHMPTLKKYAEKVSRITEFTKRRESTIAFLAAYPSSLTSYQLEMDALIDRLPSFDTPTQLMIEHRPSTDVSVEEFEDTDLLFIDSQHTYIRLTEELNKFADSVSRFIICHDTKLHDERGEDGGPGLLPALRHFMQLNPHWSVIEHTNDQYGLTVLGRDPKDKPELPSTWTMAGNLAKAVAKHVSTGARSTPKEEFENRLMICSICEHRNNERCSVCGCYIHKKAEMKDQTCPLGKWIMKGEDE